MREKDLSSGIKNLPTKVKTACSTLVSPILTKYSSSYNQFFLKLSLLKNADFTDVKNDNLLNEYKAYQATLFFGYNLKDATVNPFENWFLDNYNYDYTGGNN